MKYYNLSMDPHPGAAAMRTVGTPAVDLPLRYTMSRFGILSGGLTCP